MLTEFATLARVLADLLTVAAAAVAAISSIRNGRKIDRHDDATKMLARNGHLYPNGK